MYSRVQHLIDKSPLVLLLFDAASDKREQMETIKNSTGELEAIIGLLEFESVSILRLREKINIITNTNLIIQYLIRTHSNNDFNFLNWRRK